ncbi:MAG: M50 family metallopeptidase [Candidatus Dojkabacteria bacterium]
MIIDFLQILVPILIIGFLIFVHELGHFLAAKSVGIRVDKFAIGFGPKLWAKKWGETEYSLRLLFVGGYVQMYGDEDPSGGKAASKELSDKLRKDPKSYLSKSLLQKIWVLFAGVLMNFLVGIVAFTIYLAAVSGIVGMQRIGDYPFFGASEQENLIFLREEFGVEREQAGFLLSINEEQIDSKTQLVEILRENENKEVEVELFDGTERKSEQVVLNGEGVKSNFDLDVFPEDEGELSRGVLVGFSEEEGVFSQQVENYQDFEQYYLLSVAGNQIYTSTHLNSTLEANLGGEVEIELLSREGEKVTLELNLPAEEGVEEDEPILGVSLVYVPMGFREDQFVLVYDNPVSGGVAHSVNILGYQGYALITLIGEALAGEPEQLTENVGGVVAIGDQIGQVVGIASEVDSGVLVELLNVMATISIVLALMNILPIPVLDGGHILFAVIEKLRGKPLPEKVQNAIFVVFLVFFILLGVIVTVRDIFRIAG